MLSPTPFGPETVEQISLGIVSSVRATANLEKLDADLTTDDFKFEKDWNFVKVKSKIGSKGLLVTAFAPKVFYRIRKFHGVKEEAFQDSWTLSEENRKTKEGAGRSGSLFCFSEDRRYIFKTIYEDEKDTLMNFLPAYYDHITKNPCSLLQRIYGLFYFESLRSYVLVFGNLLYSPKGPPKEIFDLKGREVKPGHEELYDDEKVKKDKNLKRKFRFGEVMHEQLLHHLEIDVGLLKSYNIMDYSLLIGIRDDAPSDPSEICSRAADGTPLSVSVFGMSDGGFRGGATNDEDKNIIYHIGIIDCLTNYGLRKKLANFCKSMRWRVESLSTVDADYYALRFLDFMRRILVTEDMEGAFDAPVLNTAPPAGFFSSTASSAVVTPRGSTVGATV